MFQAKLPEAVAEKQQNRRHERTEPCHIAHVAVEQVTCRVEGGESVRDDPRQQDGNDPRIDRKRVLGEQVVIEDQTRDRNRVHDPEGGNAGDEV